MTDAGNIITNITWASSNEKVVKVSNGAKTGCTLTAVGIGSATVTGTITYLSKPGDTKTTANDKKITCTVTVNDFTGNTTTQLKDKSGRLLYKDSECKNQQPWQITMQTELTTPSRFTPDGRPLMEKYITIPATISV